MGSMGSSSSLGLRVMVAIPPLMLLLLLLLLTL